MEDRLFRRPLVGQPIEFRLQPLGKALHPRDGHQGPTERAQRRLGGFQARARVRAPSLDRRDEDARFPLHVEVGFPGDLHLTEHQLGEWVRMKGNRDQRLAAILALSVFPEMLGDVRCAIHSRKVRHRLKVNRAGSLAANCTALARPLKNVSRAGRATSIRFLVLPFMDQNTLEKLDFFQFFWFGWKQVEIGSLI